ncbi:mycothiol transferase [Streptomyces sp. NPDC001156]
MPLRRQLAQRQAAVRRRPAAPHVSLHCLCPCPPYLPPGPGAAGGRAEQRMRIALDVPIATLLEEYDAQAEKNRQVIAELDLDTPSKREGKSGTFTLRWILHHLIEETARHNGHLDILRELADGTTGS